MTAADRALLVQATLATQWNAACPPGTAVIVRLPTSGRWATDHTLSLAWLVNGRAMIRLAHVRGDYPLDRCARMDRIGGTQ
jgi:hypothetical protein